MRTRGQAWRALLLAVLPRRPRLLPLTIGLMALVMTMKLAGLMQGPGTPAVLASAGRALVPMARAAGHEAGKSEAAEHAAPPVAAGPSAHVLPPAVRAPPQQPPASPVDLGPSEAERALLLDLRSRRTLLDDRAAALETQQGLQAAAEKHLSERLEQLGALQARLELLEQTRRERDESNWRGLVKTYETMRPRDAATIFNDLDQPVLLQVLDRMKEAKAAMILAAMQPERARVATTELAKWRSRSPAGAQP